MPESENPGSSCSEGCQEQDSILQSKHDGGLSAGLGKLLRTVNLIIELIDYAAQRQIGQE